MFLLHGIVSKKISKLRVPHKFRFVEREEFYNVRQKSGLLYFPPVVDPLYKTTNQADLITDDDSKIIYYMCTCMKICQILSNLCLGSCNSHTRRMYSILILLIYNKFSRHSFPANIPARLMGLTITICSHENFQ